MSDTKKQVMDIRTSMDVSQGSNEKLRNWSDNGWKRAEKDGNYDRSRESLNFEVIRGGRIVPINKTKSLKERMEQNLSLRGIRDPNEGKEKPNIRTVVEFIFGGNHDQMHSLAFGEQKVDLSRGADNSRITRCKDIESWAKDVYGFVAEKFGEDNIVSFIVHLDETAPHVHCSLMPITKDNRFSFKKVFHGRTKDELRDYILSLHDDLAEINSKWGLKRGTSIAETKAKHRSTEDYRRHLEDVCLSLQDEIDSHQHALNDLRTELAKAERRVKGLSTMIDNLQYKIHQKENTLAAIESRILNGEGDVTELERQVSELRKELSTLNSQLSDKEAKLEVADEQLSLLQNDMVSITEHRDALREEIAGFSKDVETTYRSRLSMAAAEMMATEFRQLSPHLTTDNAELFDGTILQDLAEQGNKMFMCGLMLMAGYVDQATQFAQTHGGGGGSPGKGWGRKPNDDDREWARRCLRQSSHMMRAPGKRRIKR